MINNSIILILIGAWMKPAPVPYVEILAEELFAALGCTEPISIALAAAKAREVLGREAERIVVRCSGNLIKNAKAVHVPNTGGLKGIEVSAIAGMVAAAPEKGMEVLAGLTDRDRARIHELAARKICEVEIIPDKEGLHLILEMKAGGESSLVEIIHTHTNVSRIEKNGTRLLYKDFSDTDYTAALTDRSGLSVAGIYGFSTQGDIGPVRELVDLQIAHNSTIAQEGLRNPYGLNVGSAVKEVYGDSVWAEIRAMAAAGSDARMNGCSLPVVINSGSGNQGITLSLPLIVYARHTGADKEKLVRALILANLVTIRLKAEIGRLSAYCGAMSASAGAAAGLSYLAGGGLKEVEGSIVNTLANVSGVICDGAKASCAAKIATGIDAAIIAHHLAMQGKVYEDGCGIVKGDIEATIDAVGRLGHDGMRETDQEILRIMLAG